MFEQVSFMNKCFGNVRGDYLNTDWKRLQNQTENILDEYNELVEALASKDKMQVRDALCDIMVFTLGAYYILGADANKDMQDVFKSNMSKLCANQEELDLTKQHYAFLGVETYAGGEFPAAWVKSSKDQTDAEGKNYPAHKFLKNINWKEPAFHEG